MSLWMQDILTMVIERKQRMRLYDDGDEKEEPDGNDAVIMIRFADQFEDLFFQTMRYCNKTILDPSNNV